MKWRGVSRVMVMVASMAAAGASAASDRQRLGIPWQRLDLSSRQRLHEVTDHAILFRDVLGIAVESQQAVFDFLMEHPDFAATAGRTLGIVNYRIVKQRERVFWGDDARGATGTFELMYTEPGKRIYLAKGTFVKRFLPTIHGRIVLVLVFAHQTDQHGESRVITDVRGYLRIDNPILGILTRIAKPVVGPIVDKKVLRTFAAQGRLTEQASHDPAALYHTLAASREIDKNMLREFRRALRCCADERGPP